MNHAQSSSTATQIFLCIFLLGYLLNFVSGLQWQKPGHAIFLVAEELKLFSGMKNVKKYAYCLCSSYRAQFLSDLFYFGHMNWWV